MTKRGIRFNESITFEQWENVGKFWGEVRESKQFWIGDWSNAGEQKYGEKYAQAIDSTGYDYAVIANMRYVCSRVELSRRRENLSFEHHKEVAPLEPEQQTQWLNTAESENLNVKELRASVKARRVVKDVVEDKNSKMGGLITIEGWSTLAIRWVSTMREKRVFDALTPTKKQEIKAELKPIVDFYNELQ
jgi:hypothetical protein